MDHITVGLDFGTHQTKICVQIVPDEGRGQARYEFFTFGESEDTSRYFLPSTVFLMPDNTLMYGRLRGIGNSDNNTQTQEPEPKPAKKSAFDIGTKARELFAKYDGKNHSENGLNVLVKMLSIYQKQLQQKEEEEEQEKTAPPIEQAEEMEKSAPSITFRYFKQAVLAGYSWTHPFSSTKISILYLSYILFLLEEQYGQNFSINMGVPADSVNYEQKKRKAVELLLNAYELVENIYANDKEAFLKTKLDDLLHKIPDIKYSKDLQEEYFIKVFPEAYAGLTTMTSQRLLGNNMCLYVDIGGGTTDFSFFTVRKVGERLENTPSIYRYWSISRGLNYLAENSGFDYSEGDFEKRVKREVLNAYRSELNRNARTLEGYLLDQLHQKSDVSDKYLFEKLNKGIVVYNGGGSTFMMLTTGLGSFNQFRVISSKLWNNVEIKDKEIVKDICPLLTTSFGLSLSKEENDVKLSPFTSLFADAIKYVDPEKKGRYSDDDNDDRTPRGRWV